MAWAIRRQPEWPWSVFQDRQVRADGAYLVSGAAEYDRISQQAREIRPTVATGRVHLEWFRSRRPQATNNINAANTGHGVA